jgi:dTDP-4-dehydrorhamnose reductase
MSTHLVIGASGLIGEYLIRAGSVTHQVLGTFRSNPIPGMFQLDICNRPQVQSLIERLCPSIIYLPAALTNVDYCEMHSKEAHSIDVVGVQNVVQAIGNTQIKLVYFSTDYVFDGKSGPYREDDLANPINEYGRQKLLAEQYISLHMRDCLIVRTTGVYGWERGGKNFVYRVLETLGARNMLRVPRDQIGNPTYAPNLAQVAVALAVSDATGVYNISGPTRVSRYEFACEIAKVFNLDIHLIEAVLTNELAQPARRPLNAGLIVAKVSARLGIELLDYRKGLREMAKERGIDS